MFIEFQVGWLCSWLGHPCDVLMGVDINLFRRMRSFEALWEGWAGIERVCLWVDVPCMLMMGRNHLTDINE